MFLLYKALIVSVCFVATYCFANTEIGNQEKPKDYILCRGCGRDISSTQFLISKLSPASLYAVNDTVFNEDKVLIQVLSNSIFLQFAVITVGHSDCGGIGEWEENELWFPGYRWQHCMCPDCGDFLGWVFEPIRADSNSKPKPFSALNLQGVVGESFVDSLTKYPTIGNEN